MADYKEKIIAYIEGKISPEEFFPYLEANPALFDWLQSVVPEGKTQIVHEEVTFDYFLEQLSEEEQKAINEAQSKLFTAKEAVFDIQFELSKILVNLLDKANKEKNIFGQTIIPIMLYHLKCGVDNPEKNKEHIHKLPDLVRSLFEEKYLTNIEKPYDVHSIVDYKSRTQLWYYVEVQSRFAKLMQEIFPEENIVRDETMHQKAAFTIDICPDYIGGADLETMRVIDEIIDNIIASIPENLSKTARIKIGKEKIRESFPCKTKKHPYWVQNAEWQISASGKPMRFIEEKRKKGKEYKNMLYKEYYFEDVDTGEIRIVEQFT